MSVKIAAPGRHVGMELGDTVDDGHGVAVLLGSCLELCEREA
jgi:hypothetical protein